MNTEILKVLSNYIVLSDVKYLRADGIDLYLDIYLPADNVEFEPSDLEGLNAIDGLPTVVFFHGGGWVEGQKSDCVLHLLPYLSKGWSVVNVEYRLGGESLAPAAVVDARSAVWWVKRNGNKYGFNPDQIVLTGLSAGGHLALLAGMLPASEGFDGQSPELVAPNNMISRSNAALPELEVAAIINWAGITDVGDLIKEPNLRSYALQWLGCSELRESTAKRVSPLGYIRKGLPPVLSLHGDNDVVVPYSHAVRLHESLDSMDVPNQLHTIKGKEHFDFSIDDWKEAYDKIDIFLERYVL